MRRFRWWLNDLLLRLAAWVEPPLDQDLDWQKMVRDYVLSDEAMENMERNNALIRKLSIKD